MADTLTSGDASELAAGMKTVEGAENTHLQHSSLQTDAVGNSLNHQNDAKTAPQVVGEVDVAHPTAIEDASELGSGAKSQTGLLDPLSYTKSEEFTSEIFKIQIHNLPKFGFNDLKKRLKSHLKLNPHKIKSDKRYVTYVCFKNEQDRDEALGKLHGHVWKGKTLQAKIAAPVADPYLRKRNDISDNQKSQTGKDSADLAPVDSSKALTKEEAEARLRASVSPLWDTDYTQQLQIKTDKIKDVMDKLARNHFVKHLFKDRFASEGLPCPLLPIVPSPVTAEYRNKNEFTVGYSLDGKVIVGFRYGLYKEGTTAVGESTNLGIAMPAAIPVVQSFQEFVAKSEWLPYRQETGAGHWQTLTVRTFLTGDVMALINFVPRKLEQSEIDGVKAALKEFYTTGEGKNVKITSFYFRVMGDKGQTVKSSSELLFGESHVFESLMNLRFRISPEAFFQVNTPATEKLYQLISDWCNVSPSTTVLDICCGTGTIGLSMAKKVKQVIGIEMCPQAVEDAKVNAAINEIDNATFHCAKVEDIISKVMASVDSSDIVAVVDPPRPGLHKDVIRTLRRSSGIQRLVYVSCNPDGALDNLADLLRPETGRHKGAPFKMIKAVPVDLFPGTKHCELVILFSRNDISATDLPACVQDDSITVDAATCMKGDSSQVVDVACVDGDSSEVDGTVKVDDVASDSSKVDDTETVDNISCVNLGRVKVDIACVGGDTETVDDTVKDNVACVDSGTKS
ncbi:unnamed protein product [Candidula unifasciata]|uniref:tRNA (uracil(54)-C(5))-methyltransferase n=1 Tax=Candidula unifasciata TaxID=100452 RepID=A0A8S3YPL4_9EUPU|nr:unnamed protein product [Candidula unifasciata]